LGVGAYPSDRLYVKDLIDELICGVAVQKFEETHCHVTWRPPYGDDESRVLETPNKILLGQDFKIAAVVGSENSVLI